MNKRIITAAITGSIHTPTMSPYLPITPQQIIEEILAVHEAGGSVCHVHVRDPQTGHPVTDLDLFGEIVTTVKKHCDMVLCLTTGGAPGMTIEERVKTVTAFSPELASFNAGSINFAVFPFLQKYNEWKYEWEPEFLERTENNVFANSFKTLREYCALFEEQKTRAELEVYDAGMIDNIAFLINRGYLRKPVYLQFVLGILGGISASLENLVFLVSHARRMIGDFDFSVCVAGREQIPLCLHSLLFGGHARVGMEDNLYLERGVMAKSNAEQVSKLIRIMKEVGLEPATPSETRKILGLKGLDQVGF